MSAVDIDAAPAHGSSKRLPERRCMVTRETLPTGEMLRFVVGPDETVVPDIRGKLPGRGAWITCSRSLLEQAIKKNTFSKSFKQQARIPADLADQIDSLLFSALSARLAMAKKAGILVTGFNKVASAVQSLAAELVLHASEASDEGRRKVRTAIHTASEMDDQGFKPVVSDLIDGETLDRLFGLSNVHHVALLSDPMSEAIKADLARLCAYRGIEALTRNPKPDGLSGTDGEPPPA